MGLFSRKRKKSKSKAETPKIENSLSTSKSIFWGGSKAGTHVDENTAMQTAAVYACVKLISESIASLPLHIYRREKNGSIAVHDHHLYTLLHYSPNPEMTSYTFRQTMMFHLLIYGNAYAQIIRNGGGRVVELSPLLPDRMQIHRDEQGSLFYSYYRGVDERGKKENNGYIAFKREDILHIKGLSCDGLYGQSPIAVAKNAVGMAIATEEFGSSFFANGATPSGVLEHPETVKNHADVRAAWESLLKGTKNSNRVVVLEDGLKYKPVSITPDEAQFLQTRKFQLNEIARIFGVPPHMIGDLDKSSFNNIEQQSLEYVKYCINPWVECWEQEMHMYLIPKSEQKTHYIKFNIDGLMRGDYASRMKGYSVGIQNGFLCANDVRGLEEMNLIDHPAGNRFFVNGNSIGIEDVGIQWKGRGENS
jgi:HK97 family phage portal protein